MRGCWTVRTCTDWDISYLFLYGAFGGWLPPLFIALHSPALLLAKTVTFSAWRKKTYHRYNNDNHFSVLLFNRFSGNMDELFLCAHAHK